MALFDKSNLPEDPRGDGFVDAYGPDGRKARVREADGPFTLIDPETGQKYEIPTDGFIVWEDGVYRAITRDEFLDGPWDVDLGDGGTSAIEAADVE
jgi:hypothetical protein